MLSKDMGELHPNRTAATYMSINELIYYNKFNYFKVKSKEI